MQTPRERAISSNLDSARVDIERTIDESSTRDHWRNLIKGTLMYWLGQLYDEGSGHTKDLETSLAILRRQVSELKKENDDLIRRLYGANSRD